MTESGRPGAPPAVVWLTGLSGAGKSALADALAARLERGGRSAYVLDGDRLRQGLSSDLDFSPAARSENVRRAAHMARLLADAGPVAIVSLISPFAADRALAREVVEEAGISFLEVYVNTPLEVCEARDAKGLYARARRGEIADMTGIHSPYEPPVAPELEVHPAERTPAELVEQVLERLGSLPPPLIDPVTR